MPSAGTALAALITAMSPQDGADEQVDWEAMRRAWGMSFPSDYVAFMATHGAGGIDDAFSVLTPEAATQPTYGQELGSMSG